MNRRLLIASTLSITTFYLTGCAVQTKSDTTMPDDAFTPDGAKRYLANCRTARDAIAVYGDPVRTMKSKKRPSQKAFVWEWVGVRPSFLTDKTLRESRTPTVKRELHVWCNSDNQIVDIEVIGFFYTQVKVPGLSPLLAELRSLTSEELGSLKVPLASDEVLEEYNTYYANK